MENSRKRRTSRSRTWPETRATLELVEFASPDARSSTFKITGKVTDIGSKGMFLKTFEYVPVSAKANITIHFDPGARPPIPRLSAQGKIIRRCSFGIGIRFTAIDLGLLQECIVAKLNLDNPPGSKARSRHRNARSKSPSCKVFHLKDRKPRNRTEP